MFWKIQTVLILTSTMSPILAFLLFNIWFTRAQFMFSFSGHFLCNVKDDSIPTFV